MTAKVVDVPHITLTALVDGHTIRVRRDVVRVMEDVDAGVRVTLGDGTEFLVRGCVEEMLNDLKMESKTL